MHNSCYTNSDEKVTIEILIWLRMKARKCYCFRIRPSYDCCLFRNRFMYVIGITTKKKIKQKPKRVKAKTNNTSSKNFEYREESS